MLGTWGGADSDATGSLQMRNQMRELLLVVAVLLSTLALAQAPDPAPPTAVTAEQPASTAPAPSIPVAEPRAKPDAAYVRPDEWWQRPEWWLVAALCLIALVGAGLAF